MKSAFLASLLALATCGVNAQAAKTTVPPQPSSLSAAPAARPSPLSVEKFEGGSMVIDLSYNVKANERSSLKREWMVLRDSNAPAEITGGAGVAVDYETSPRSSTGHFIYKIPYIITAREALTAIEIRAHVIDAFGNLLRSLKATEIMDLPPGEKYFVDKWRVWSENEATEAFASVTYVARARTATGSVYEVSPSEVLAHVRKFARQITESDLTPKRESPDK